ncbi:hypothetical protein DFH09DRAFT_1208273, partial [Mycena vulgaris]
MHNASSCATRDTHPPASCALGLLARSRRKRAHAHGGEGQRAASSHRRTTEACTMPVGGQRCSGEGWGKGKGVGRRDVGTRREPARRQNGRERGGLGTGTRDWISRNGDGEARPHPVYQQTRTIPSLANDNAGFVSPAKSEALGRCWDGPQFTGVSSESCRTREGSPGQDWKYDRIVWMYVYYQLSMDSY